MATADTKTGGEGKVSNYTKVKDGQESVGIQNEDNPLTEWIESDTTAKDTTYFHSEEIEGWE